MRIVDLACSHKSGPFDLLVSVIKEELRWVAASPERLGFSSVLDVVDDAPRLRAHRG